MAREALICLTFLDKQLLKILVAFENKYPPVMEKKVGDISVPIERKAERKVNGIEREIMMEEALQAANCTINISAFSCSAICIAKR